MKMEPATAELNIHLPARTDDNLLIDQAVELPPLLIIHAVAEPIDRRILNQAGFRFQLVKVRR